MKLNMSALPLVLDDKVKLVGVKFYGDRDGELGWRTYHYKTTLELSEGDHVVVVVANVPKVVQVVDLSNPAPKDDITYKWIVAKVDFTDYEYNMQEETTLLDAMRKANLKKKLQAALENMDGTKVSFR